MKTAVLVLIGCLAGTLVAQTPLNQQVISSPRFAPPITNAPGNLTITNQFGGTLSLTDLDAQLANLKTDVERTLPMLAAVAGQSGVSPAQSRSQQLANAASNFVANALGRNPNQTTAIPPGENSPRLTNFAGFLHGLISTNTGGAGGVSLDPNTVNLLATLRNDLQPVLSILDNLNVTSFPAGTNQPAGGFATPLTPTGR